ncbi:MAG: 1-aminocyclopropane-1-carboxylate deaminase/D-cysteine desulfhydrase [Saprospiraceae bacterium]|nr:1-aminocyclopropane-1-carboxylate deaminase/D-cysteine desulfhydrase [Saprospiraceae bacterium]
MNSISAVMTLPSFIVHVILPVTLEKKIKLLIKRDDLIHPWVSGNKWRKLKYNIDCAINNHYNSIITFGGAFSNHIFAVAGACAMSGLKSIGIIRGEIDPANPTLKFCAERNMTMIPVTRNEYREKEASSEIQQILLNHPEALVIPEGGTNALAFTGVAEIWDELKDQLDQMPDYMVLSAGTGGTAAGLLSANDFETKIISISALKSTHLYNEILHLSEHKNKEKLTVIDNYHFGGYGKWTTELLENMQEFENKTKIPLDHVYNGKSVFGMMDMIKNDYFPEGSTILYLHTGGLQGKAGLSYMESKNVSDKH